METSPLKSFATWARASLIREVTARIAVVLAPASPERVEQPNAVEALEKAVTVAGGGDKGKAAVADKVAYTWFNRIIALRFMDANGYTGVGVVSPQAGVETGQPEILAEAKRGNIDAAVVGGKTREAVSGLLNGTRRSDDAQGEAYALLLADYCRYWNRAMPFMFEREGDFTELLIPANLLADDSVPSRATKVLAKDVCQDVEVIGWLYQFYILERKDEVFAGFKKNKKAGADEIPAATQLFTPHWIVRYLVENSLGRLWMLNHPGSRLVDQMDYYIAPVDDETDFLKIGGPAELKVIDPACGSGHMLTYAFDLLYAIYAEEGYAPAEIPGLILTNNLYGVEIDPRAGALAAFALTMKARARQRTFFNKQVEPNICVLDPIGFTPDEIDLLLTRGGDKHAEEAFWNQFEHADTFGSLIQPDPELAERLKKQIAQIDDAGNILLADALGRAEKVVLQAEYLSPRYFVVVANPPYLGSRKMGARLTAFAKAQYSMGRQDLYSCFVQRAIELVDPRGMVAMILGDTWMSITSFEGFRRVLLDNHAFTSFVHLRDVSNHPDIFGANAAFVLDMCGGAERPTPYFRLTPLDGEVKRRQFLAAASDPESSDRYLCSVEQLGCIPGTPIAYWLSEAMRAAFAKGKRVSEFADPRQGLATADNNQFLRSWWEVSAIRTAFSCANRDEAVRSGARWFPYNKGGEFRRWWGNQQHLVNWERDGSKIKAFGTENGGRQRSAVRNPHTHFQPSVSWSDITSGAPAFRSYPQGFLHDVTGMSVFGDNYQRERLISFLNSSVATSLLRVVAPTLHAQIGDISLLPVEEYETPSVILDLLTSVAGADWDDFEISWDFGVPSWMRRVLDAELAGGERHPSPLRSTRLGSVSLRRQLVEWSARWDEIARDQQTREAMNNQIVAEAYGLEGDVSTEVPLHRVSLTRNVEFRYGPGKSAEEYSALERADVAAELVSYAIGCMFGRYSLDVPGLILADQGATVEDYLAKVPNPRFVPDADNVIPIVDGDWFEDDVVARFRSFLRVAFGEQHFEENLRFVTESLGVKDIRDYFVRSFYKDHVQRYKKRPIYWLFSSPKGSFNALIYMHRYTPSTISTVLNEYLREFRAKLSSSLHQQERLAAGGGTPRQQVAAQKEADRLRKVLLELEEYEHDVLYPLASRQLAIDLDDGVKANYPKFGEALKKIPDLRPQMSDAVTVRPHLLRWFDSRRIVFWHDPDGQYAADLDTLDLPRVQIIRVANDEFAVKNRLLQDEPEGKFLVYRSGQVPSGIGDWLLDLELAYGVFTADRTALVAQDLGLVGEGIDEVIQAHEKFFNAVKRVQSLKALLSPEDDAARLRAKISAVVLGQREHSLLEITRTLLSENAKGAHAKYDALVDYGLDGFYWQGVTRIYGYESPTPSIDDLLLWIFQRAIEGFMSARPGGLQNIQLDFASLRNDRRSQEAMAVLAKRAASDLDYKSKIEDASFRDLVGVDLFEETDQKIISDLARAVAEQTVTPREVAEVVRARQSSVWIDNYRRLYTAVASASELLGELASLNLAMQSFDDGLERYRREWFRVDQLYRQFVFAARTAEYPKPLEALREQVEKRYTNKYVYELGNAWQQQVDRIEKWRSTALRSQTAFYARYVEPLVRDGDKKAVVIISDAMRYEVADELGSLIRREDRFDATLEAVLGVLPSYTQLGMAALLPHSTLKHSADAKTVLADDQPTNNTTFRGKILQAVGGSAIQAEDFKAMSADERRELYKANRVLYVYHNRIDATGEKPGTERQVFEAVDDTLRDIVDLVKKLASANATNIFITADHGFLFQDDALADTFFLSTQPQGDDIKAVNRRFVLGTGLKVDLAFATFEAAQLGLESELEVQIPKSIHRLRLAGGGSRFVHGGATLQEIVVPVLAVNKKRKSDTRLVNVEVWPESDKITTGQVVVRLFQTDPVNDKVQPRTLRAGLYVGETLISNVVELMFDQTSTDKRDRYQSARMLLSQESSDYNNRAVEFRLEERIPNTNQWRIFAKAVYTLKRSFVSDFDF